ncbi:MAG TPA: PaaI family thioesterase [Actinomycetales bacterium]|nr:PaaI family thioesterase [Actinomycetales bacterium]
MDNDDTAAGGERIDLLTEHAGEMADLVAQLRRLRSLTAAHSIDGDVTGATEALRRVADELETRATPSDLRIHARWHDPHVIGTNPVIGNINPIAPPLEPEIMPDGSIRAELTLGHEYHGPPGCVHGGVVAMVIDEMLGVANAVAGIPAMTVELDVRYHSTTPLGQPLVFTSRVTRRDDRKIWTEAELHAGDRLCASATGMFVVPRTLAERMAAEEESRVTAEQVAGE